MHSNNTSQTVLRALFELAQADQRAHIARVALLAGMSCPQVDAVLLRLEATKLVDATRVRLTMAGLAVAVRLPALPRRRPNVRAA